ncbi:carboxylesterase/lipase family protein [Bradyrhizobium septentrionale]|uniref:Carboxylic ester hydrolase n=1 Tax=Bradyrhizobium septentrionale TaxID=1404411 RepID=A0ABZ2P4F9_9BRAD
MLRTHPRTVHPDTHRRVKGGELIGSREPNGTYAWRGIRYAAAPVGPLRWRAPQSSPAWAGVLKALEHGPMAPQYAGMLVQAPARLHGKVVGDEDCLTLNVFAPSEAPAARRRPVMVWIHGGANAAGTSATYDVARNYAAHDGIVVVTVNYRLGVLGWFCHPALIKADQATPEEQSGNFGTLDLIAALRWVRENIAAFGGDPECVTIFGESAGAQNVLTLLASPLAAGLFHRAIAQSPVADTFDVDEATERNHSPLESFRTSSHEIAARLWVTAGRNADVDSADNTLQAMPPVEVAAFLRSLSPAQLLGAVKPGTGGMYLTPRPIRDGVVLPKQPLSDLFRSGAWNRVPIILGSNRDEYRAFIADKAEHAWLLPGKFPVLRNRAEYLGEAGFLSKVWRSINLDEPADALLASGHSEVWTYRFDWDEAPAVPVLRPDLLFGAAHGMEMPFAFRDVRGELDLFKVNTPFNKAGRAAVAEAMGSAWASFAHSGVPSLPNGFNWQRRTTDRGPDSLVIDSPAGGGLRMEMLRADVSSIKAGLRRSADVSSGTARCRIYARAFLWCPMFVQHGSLDEYDQWCEEFSCNTPAHVFRPVMEV